MRLAKRIVVVAIICLLLNGISGAWTQGRAASAPDLAAYAGADREQRLVAGAKAEGKVVWYTSLAGSSYKELAKGFESKYPGVKIEPYRGTSSDIMTKISAEAQAKQIIADTCLLYTSDAADERSSV